jgi:hypothetical protein
VSLLALVFCLAVLQDAPSAPAAPEPPGVGWHEVLPGETLEGITAHYLGTSERWRENWKLNPDLVNPHRISPGTRLRIIMDAQEPSAQIRGLSRRVEEKPHPEPWVPAKIGDKLRARDGIRTYRQSSAEIGFEDGAHLRINEESLVFLREIAGPSGGPAARQTLEVVEGQADVEAKAVADQPLPPDIEVVIGDARTRTRTAAGQSSSARTRKTGHGGAQLMVFGGEGEMEAAGRSVKVATGMGTAAEAGKPPKPPEKLLPPPAPIHPASGASYEHSNPLFTWEPVGGAAGYVVEVCRDVACGQIVARAAGVAETSWTPNGLPLGELHWRVTAQGASGLDGFPSTPVAFTVRSLWRRATGMP